MDFLLPPHTVYQRHIFRDFFFFTGIPYTREFRSKFRIHIHSHNRIAHNIPYRFYLIDQNLYFHIFCLLKHLKRTFFGNKQAFARLSRTDFLIQENWKLLGDK